MTLDLLTLPEAAEKVGLEYRTLHTWIRKGVLVLEHPPSGTGRPALITDREFKIIGLLARLRRTGCGFPILREAAMLLQRQPGETGVTLRFGEDVTISAPLVAEPGKPSAYGKDSEAQEGS
jgi:DNA-binding transcriptional MerR regulator